MSNRQHLFVAGVFYLLTFWVCYGVGHADFWHSVLIAIIVGPFLWVIAMAQMTVYVVNNKEKK